MKLIYEEHEVKDGKYAKSSPTVSVRAYVATSDEEYTIPALVELRHGYWNNQNDYESTQWHMIGADGHVQTTASVIRQAIDMYDNLKQEKFRDTGD